MIFSSSGEECDFICRGVEREQVELEMMPPRVGTSRGGASPGGGSRKKKATTEMSAGGQSAEWKNSKANHVRIGNEFLAHVQQTDAELSAKWGTT